MKKIWIKIKFYYDFFFLIILSYDKQHLLQMLIQIFEKLTGRKEPTGSLEEERHQAIIHLNVLL